ncbi:MAG: holo-ACP synthase [Bowdeniella nasicola]|nr:holo-ACP synthase [Bowdeniella nasicola]
MSIRGVGVDVVDIARFTTTAANNPKLIRSVFTAAEITQAARRAGAQLPDVSAHTAWQGPLPFPLPLATQSARFLAGRFALKEAIAKVMGAPRGMRWHDCEIRVGQNRQPVVHLSGTIAHVATLAGIDSWFVSLSHDGGVVVALAVGQAQ